MRQRHRSKELIKGTRRHGSCRFSYDSYLFSKVGQSWDKINSQLSHEFKRGTYSGDKFWFNLKWHIEINCWVGAETNTIYDSLGIKVFGFFVHPFTGILSYVPGNKWAYNYPSKKNVELIRITINQSQAYEKIKGIWYWTEFKKNEFYSKHRYSETYVEPEFYIQKKVQLNKKQLKDLNLVNDLEGAQP